MPVVDRYPDAVETQGGEEFGIFCGEEVLEELGEVSEITGTDMIVGGMPRGLVGGDVTLSKKNSYFSWPRTSSIAALISLSWPG